jgi:hypothetical protein
LSVYRGGDRAGECAALLVPMSAALLVCPPVRDA